MIAAVVRNQSKENGTVFFQFRTADPMNLQEVFRSLRQVRGHFGESPVREDYIWRNGGGLGQLLAPLPQDFEKLRDGWRGCVFPVLVGLW